jgi:RNA polymerase sigma-70 factor (ECF subfamily)
VDATQSLADSLSPALEDLLGRFGGLLRSGARRHGLSDAHADELYQEVRIRLWRALSSGEKIAEVHASYVRRTALSAAIDMIRRRRARREEMLVEPREPGGVEHPVNSGAITIGPDGVLEREDLGELVWEVVGELAEPRDVVVRMYLTGYAREEIAELLGWTEAKARNLLYRGLGDLRNRLAARGFAPRRL